MRRAAKTDSNQGALVDALRAAGYSVQSLAAVGGGVPDLLVGKSGVNALLEVKDGSKVKSARQLTAAQQGWHVSWRGQVAVVETIEEAFEVLDAIWRAQRRGK